MFKHWNWVTNKNERNNGERPLSHFNLSKCVSIILFAFPRSVASRRFKSTARHAYVIIVQGKGKTRTLPKAITPTRYANCRTLLVVSDTIRLRNHISITWKLLIKLKQSILPESLLRIYWHLINIVSVV